jgi:hypothetical protein
MPEVQFRPRYAISSVRDPDPTWLRDVILDPCRPSREFGEAAIDFREGELAYTMILIADRDLGYYLKHESGTDTWLSLGDRTRLSEVVCPDDWEASAGLFVPAEAAWFAIDEFCQSGRRSDAIEWIRPREIPADGNW